MIPKNTPLILKELYSKLLNDYILGDIMDFFDKGGSGIL